MKNFQSGNLISKFWEFSKFSCAQENMNFIQRATIYVENNVRIILNWRQEDKCGLDKQFVQMRISAISWTLVRKWQSSNVCMCLPVYVCVHVCAYICMCLCRHGISFSYFLILTRHHRDGANMLIWEANEYMVSPKLDLFLS